MKKSFLRQSMLLICALLSACGGGESSSSNSDNGDASSLNVITPKTIFSKSGAASRGYVTINNPTATEVKNLHYNLGNQVGGASGVVIDPVSSANCSVVPAYNQCDVKITVPDGAIAGSFSLNVSNNDNMAGKLSRLNAASPSSLRVGVEQAAYNQLSGADGITLSYYHMVIKGTTYVMVSGLVASANAGTFNHVVLVDDNNNELANQQLISGAVSSAPGSTFNILLPVPAGVNTSQTIKVQTRQDEDVVSTATTGSTLTTVENVGITEILPGAIYLSDSNPEQNITLVNSGDMTSYLEELLSSNPNVTVSFSPDSLAGGEALIATLTLKDASLPATIGDITLKYNNGRAEVQTSAEVAQNTNATSSTPVAGLSAIFAPDNQFYKTTAGNPVSRQLTLLNTGNTTENSFSLGLPAGFSIGAGTDTNSSCTVSGNQVSNALAANGGKCSITVTYSGTTAIDPAQVEDISISYNYNNGVAAPQTDRSVQVQVTQSKANLSITPSSYDFGSIINNNVESSQNVLFTITNNGEIATDGTSFTVTLAGDNAGLFSTNTDGIDSGAQCTNSLAAGASCEINVKFGPSNAAAVNPAKATLNAGYVPSPGSEAETVASRLSGIILTAPSASINIGNAVGTTFISGSGSSDVPYVVYVNNNATLTYTYTNSGTQVAQGFYVAANNVPAGWTRTGGTCATTAPGTDLPNTGSNRCTVIFTVNSATDGPFNLDRNIMTANWIDSANPTGTSYTPGSSVTYVSVVPQLPVVTITPLPGWDTVMGSVYAFTARIANGATTVSFSNLSGINGGSFSSDSCALDSTATASCLIIVTPYATAGSYSFWDPANVENSSIGHEVASNTNSISLTVAATGATINGQASPVTLNNITGTVVSPYIYLPAPNEGAATESNTGITWGTGGTVSTRFVAGTDPDGNACPPGEEIESDTLTGLTWIESPTSTTKYNWNDAQVAPAIPTTYCGYTDWHLPSENELLSLVNYSADSESAWLNSNGFNNVQTRGYWSSTSSNGRDAWDVSFANNHGLSAAGSSHVHVMSVSLYVWPVRGGQ